MIAIKDEVVMKVLTPAQREVVAEGYWGERKVYKVTLEAGMYKCWWKYPPQKCAAGACERRGWAFDVFATEETLEAAVKACEGHFYVGRKMKPIATMA